MFESFAKVKKQVLDVAEKVKKNTDIDRDVLKNSTLEQEIFNLNNGEFKIALIAPFSAGKSTFINSLIGQDILSMEVTAETSVITKVKFSKEIRLEIEYRNKIVEVIPKENEKAITVDEAREILEKKTTVKGENTEDTIKEVRVYYPIEMCKDNVEFIDTPGLFARHEKHADITSNILPTVNAVVFMIDPESVGEQHFTEVIQNYVRNAKSSNMEEEGKHIFFVINKIDQFSEQDREKAKRELIEVLNGIINNPQIFEISAYYAMIGKMYLAKTIELIDIQRDRKICIPDPEDEGFTITGRQIQDENAHLIVEESKISELEKGLEKYLEYKNKYLITNITSEIDNVLNQSIEKKSIEQKELQDQANVDKAEYTRKMTALQSDMKELDTKFKQELSYKIKYKIVGNSSGGSISDNVKEQLKTDFKVIKNRIIVKIDDDWAHKKVGLTKDNAEDRVREILNSVNGELEILSKEKVRDVFKVFKNKIEELIHDIEEDFKEIKAQFEATEMRNIGKSFSKAGNYNIESLASNIIKEVETNFSDMIVNLNSTLSEDITEAEDDNTVVREKTGIIYGIKKLFTGNKEYVSKFDSVEFKRQISKIVMDIQENLQAEINDIADGILIMLEDPFIKISNQISSEVSSAIKNIVNIKQSIINNILQSMKNNDEDVKKEINKLQESINNLNELKQQLSELNNGFEE